MLIYVIGGDQASPEALRGLVLETAPDAAFRTYRRVSEAFSAAGDRNERPDLVIADMDVSLRGDGGEARDLAGLVSGVRKLAPEAYVILTGKDGADAVEAWRLHPDGFLLKPFDPARVREETEWARKGRGKKAAGLTVRCFGYFEAFSGGEPLLFKRKRARELLAFLIDRRGAACSAEDVIAALYEDVAIQDMKKARQNVRNLVCDLKRALSSAGQGGVLVRKGGTLAVRTELVDCDYYRLLNGEKTAAGLFRGEYMEQYSWAERTKGTLEFDRTR